MNYYLEIPSVEHPHLLLALLDDANVRGVRVDRVSQGGGLQFLSDSEAEEMVRLAHGAGVSIYSFVSVRNSFESLVDEHAGDQVRGEAAFASALDELRRCSEIGFDGVLVADVGLLAAAGELIRGGQLGRLRLKTSAAIAPQNAAAASVYERLGATSINVAASMSIDDLVALRESLDPETTLDIYIESPAQFGGGLRYREVPEFVSKLSPVFLKFGLRNAPPTYPYGKHLEPAAEASIREKVRRAALVVEALERVGVTRPRALTLTDGGQRSGGS